MHWLVIIIGTIILSFSLSNSFYKLIIINRLKFKINRYLSILFRIILFLTGIIVIFFGLFIESI